jgi:D-3-phosphoglycerate dehydrogenase
MRAVFLDHVFDDISAVRGILEGVAEVVESQCGTEEQAIEAARGADALLVVNYAPVSRRVIETLDRCRIISRFGIGVDAVDIAAATGKGIAVTNVPDYCLDEVSDHAVAMLLHLERRLSRADASVRAALRYRPQDLKPIRGLTGAVAGIIGLGRIGRLTARKLAAFGMQVIFFDPFVAGDCRGEGWEARKVELETLVRESDAIIIHAPATPESHHCIDGRTLSLARRAPILVNVGRGELVDTTALVAAVRSGKVSAAGLDVLEEADRLSPTAEVLHTDGILLSPHSAWYSEKALARLQATAATSVREALSGRIPLHCVNPEACRRAGLFSRGTGSGTGGAPAASR